MQVFLAPEVSIVGMSIGGSDPVTSAGAVQAKTEVQATDEVSVVTGLSARSGFDAAATGANVGTSDTETPAVSPVLAGPERQLELVTVEGVPPLVSAADCVTRETKLAAVEQAAQEGQAEAVRAAFEAGTIEALDKAFMSVLAASKTPGTHEVQLGDFTGYVEVDAATGNVNGKPLASDVELARSAELTNLRTEDRVAQLKQVGMPNSFLLGATPTEIFRAFQEVELRRQAGTVGDFSFTMVGGKPMKGGITRDTYTTNFSIGANGTLGATGKPLETAKSPAVLKALWERETVQWPGGRPEVLRPPMSKVEQWTESQIPQADMLATLKELLDPASVQRLEALQGKGDGVEGIEKAYARVLEARKHPGDTTLNLQFTSYALRETTVGGDGAYQAVLQEPLETQTFSLALKVAADGKVNGKPLLVDDVARLANEAAVVAPAVKDQLLARAGLSAEWISGANDAQKSWALGRMREAGSQPGTHVLDFSYSNPLSPGGDAGGNNFVSANGRLQVTSTGDGMLNGKLTFIDSAIATQLEMSKMTMIEKRMVLGQAGVPLDAVRDIGPEQAANLLTFISMSTLEPGSHSTDFQIDGHPWILGVEVDAKGNLAGIGAQKLPEEKVGQQIFGFVLMVASVVYPPIAPLCQTISAGMAIANGAKGLSLVASVASAVAGMGELAGASWAGTMSNVATAIGAVNGVNQAVKNENFLGLFSAVVNLTSSVGALSGVKFDSTFELVKQIGTVANVANAISQNDLVGAAGTIFAQLNQWQRAYGQDPNGPGEVGGIRPSPAGTKLGQINFGTSINDNFIDARGRNLGNPGGMALMGTMPDGTPYDISGMVNTSTLSPNGFAQGNTGNCTMVSMMQMAALWNPGLLDERISINGNTALVKLNAVDGKTVTVLIDATNIAQSGWQPITFPDDSILSNPASAAKAFIYQQAVIAALPQLMRSTDTKYNANWSSAVGGFIPATMGEIITGRPATWTSTAFNSSSTIYSTIVDGNVNSSMMVASSKPDSNWFFSLFGGLTAQQLNAAGIVEQHAFGIVGAYTDESGQQMVRLMNPWRNGEPGSLGTKNPALDGVNDGIFSIKLSDFMKYFAGVTRINK